MGRELKRYMEYGNGYTNQLVWRSSENRYHNEEFQVDENNQNVNVSILSQFISNGEKVLDIGCGEGKLGKILIQKNCEMYGIEIDQVAKENALKNSGYKDIFSFNIENFEENSEEQKRFLEKDLQFDVIALIDILEHVINPTVVLLNSLKFLKDNGRILVSIPNVNNADILLNLLQGKFNYREAGVLDNTHTKYFTKSSFVEWIADVNSILAKYNLECEYIGGTFGYTKYLEWIKEKKPFVYNFIQLNPYFHTIQHLFALTRSPKENGTPNGLKVLLEEKNVDMVEVLEQCLRGELAKEGYVKLLSCGPLPNERNILELRAESAEEGWKKCAESLAEAKKGWRECAKSLEEAKSGWEKCADALNTLKKSNANSEKIFQSTIKSYENKIKQIENDKISLIGRIEDLGKENAILVGKQKETIKKWQECSRALEQARKGWNECADALENLKSNKHKCEENYLMAVRMYEDKLNIKENDIKEMRARTQFLEERNAFLVNKEKEILEKWEECSRALDQAKKGWRECAEALDYLKSEKNNLKDGK